MAREASDLAFCHINEAPVQYFGDLKFTFRRNARGPFFKVESLSGQTLPRFTIEPDMPPTHRFLDTREESSLE